MKNYIMSLDQGTTSSRCIIFNKSGEIVSKAQKEFKQIYPKAGYVEHVPNEIWSTQISVAIEALAMAEITGKNIAAIGITNQRETTIMWDKFTGDPVCNAIVWQCRRTATTCEEIENNGLNNLIRNKTGLKIDAYFSATKIKWILDNIDGVRKRAENGEILFGTVDTWLIWKLTKGKKHITDYTNASRTMIFNIHTLEWDKELLNLFNIPESILPKVVPSSGISGYCDKSFFDYDIPISGVAGDQQSALFGQCCFEKGDAKNTYGTGCFMLINTGEKIVESKNGLLTTIAWNIENKVTYAIEGSVFIAGAVVKWIRDEMRMIREASDSELYASRVDNTNGMYIVPAFVGLGAPYWEQRATGTIVGITRGTSKEHFVRAALESIAYQSNDVLKAMEEDVGFLINNLKVDGGASENNFLMQFQSNILNVSVMRPYITETTALGAAYLAGLAVGYWDNVNEIIKNIKGFKVFNPNMQNQERDLLINGWKQAVKRTISV